MAKDLKDDFPPGAIPVFYDGESPLQPTPGFCPTRFPDFPPAEPFPEMEKALSEKREAIAAMQSDDLKVHQLPLARVKKIMKSDEEVRMIGAEVPALFAQACEVFIVELTMRAWKATEENNRKTLQRSDVSAAVSRTDVFDFLIDIVPKEYSRK